ncbi:MAG: hypothetical protein ACUVWZ_10260 [Anaerolineae bacterium]
MESPGCNLGLGLILGLLIAGLLVGGGTEFKAALRTIKGFKKEKEKANEEIKKAKEKRNKGYEQLVGAFVLILAGIILFVLTLYLLVERGGF